MAIITIKTSGEEYTVGKSKLNYIWLNDLSYKFFFLNNHVCTLPQMFAIVNVAMVIIS